MNRNTEIQDIEIEIEWNIGEIKKGQSYSWSTLIDLYSDLYSDYLSLQEELEHLKQDIEDNYKPIPISEQVGIDDKDFI